MILKEIKAGGKTIPVEHPKDGLKYAVVYRVEERSIEAVVALFDSRFWADLFIDRTHLGDRLSVVEVTP